MGTRIIISSIVAFLLALAGGNASDLLNDDSMQITKSVEYVVSVPDNSDMSYYACVNLNPFSAGTNSTLTIKAVKYTHSRHISRSYGSMTIFNRISTHQISDMMGTLRLLISLEKLVI